MRYFLLIFVLLCLTVFFAAGRRGSMSRKPPLEIFPDMDKQPKLRPQTYNEVFENGLSSQLPVAGTVARGAAYEDSAVNTGKVPGTTNWVASIPMPVTAEFLERGQQHDRWWRDRRWSDGSRRRAPSPASRVSAS